MNKWMISGICVAAIGVVGLVGGFVYDVVFVNIPYQDPTPQMQAQWNANERMASVILQSGAAVLLAGCLIFAIGLVIRKYRRR